MDLSAFSALREHAGPIRFAKRTLLVVGRRRDHQQERMNQTEGEGEREGGR